MWYFEYLASRLNDVVLVPQQALLEADPHPCRLRRAKRYRSLPTPLVCVEWWRICVDEAQTIEAHTAKATEMLLKLHCVNRWCVTGTLIHRNVEGNRNFHHCNFIVIEFDNAQYMQSGSWFPLILQKGMQI